MNDNDWSLTRRGRVVVRVLAALFVLLVLMLMGYCDRSTLTPECRRHMTAACIEDSYGGHVHRTHDLWGR